MKAPPLAKNYKALTPEERFRLILAASGRGDEAEAARLVNAGGRITLSVPDHSPYAHAFSDLALMTFIDLLEEAAEAVFEGYFGRGGGARPVRAGRACIFLRLLGLGLLWG